MATAARRESGEASSSGGSESGYSGRLLLRMPRALHAQLAHLAERDGISLNQLIIGTLARSVESPVEDAEAAAPKARPEPRLLTLALAVNLVVIVVAGVIAVVLLVAAWRGSL
jgi:HicB-like protein involved in pilus formation